MNKPTILVIGSNSFSGSHFVKKCLSNGYQVLGISRSEQPKNVFLPYLWGDNKDETPLKIKNFNFYSIDINVELKNLFDLIEEKKPSIIVNFAAQGMVAESWLNPTHWYRTNVLSQVSLHDYLRKKSFLKKYVHITTPEVYGSTDQGWIKENTPFYPSTPYAVSRASCDLHLMSFYKAYNFPVIFTRAANVYGPGQQLYRIIPRAFLSAFFKKPMQLHGGGRSIRSFIHIEDVMDATLKLALNADNGTAWHISTKESISIIDLVKKIFLLLDEDFNRYVEVTDDRLGKDQNYLLDSEKLRTEHTWSDKINLDDGLDETLSWIKSNSSILEKLSWEYQHKL